MKALVLDFDGVLFDSARESFAVSRRTYLELRPESSLAARDEEKLYRDYLELMPLGNGAADYGAVLTMLEQGRFPRSQEEYGAFRDEQEAPWLARYRDRFYEVRHEWAGREPETWRALMPPYAEFVAMLRRRKGEVRYAIATAKDRPSVDALLATHSLTDLFSGDLIVDGSAGRDKSVHLDTLRRRLDLPAAALTFVDDKVTHLDSASSLGVRGALAAWGFNGTREHDIARARGHLVCSLENAEAMLFESGTEDTTKSFVHPDAASTEDVAADERANPSDRYHLGGKLGEGGMATVVAAEDIQLDRTVAIKRMKPPLHDDPVARKRFVKEAKILASMSQHGTVAIYELGSDADIPFYAMECVQGKTLSELLRARTEEEIHSREHIVHFVDVFERACQTMAYAHANGVIHRDIKPGNVMVDDEFGTVTVMDWGLAKRVGTDDDPGTPAKPARASASSEDLTTSVMGTPGYMSPEQIRETATVGFPADVFALGVILYETLTGKKPFAGKGPFEKAQAAMFDDPPTPLSVNPRVGRELSAICMKALRKEPERRYPTARELADDIRRFREFRPVSVVDPRWFERAIYWARRNAVLATALGTLLAAVLVAGGVAGALRYTQYRMVNLGLAAVEESLERVNELQQQVTSARGRLDETEAIELQARLSTAHLTLRGRLAAVLGFTLPSPHPRVLELGRWQSIRLIEMLIEAGNYPMAEVLAETTLEQVEQRNVLRLSDEDQERIRELLAEALEKQGKPLPADQ